MTSGGSSFSKGPVIKYGERGYNTGGIGGVKFFPYTKTRAVVMFGMLKGMGGGGGGAPTKLRYF